MNPLEKQIAAVVATHERLAKGAAHLAAELADLREQVDELTKRHTPVRPSRGHITEKGFAPTTTEKS